MVYFNGDPRKQNRELESKVERKEDTEYGLSSQILWYLTGVSSHWETIGYEQNKPQSHPKKGCEGDKVFITSPHLPLIGSSFQGPPGWAEHTPMTGKKPCSQAGIHRDPTLSILNHVQANAKRGMWLDNYFCYNYFLHVTGKKTEAYRG